jgi:membrane protease YdiL (CAAX protease family)
MARVSFAAVKRVAIALGWFVLFIVVGVLVTLGLVRVVPEWPDPWGVPRTGVFEVIAFGIATYVVGKLLNKYSWDRMGWRRPALGPLLRGALVGALMASFAIALAVILDGARVHWTGDFAVWPRIGVPLLIGLVLAALGEELSFRGYPLRRLADGIGVLPAILLLAVLFGLAHVRNPSASVFSTVNVALAAIWLSIAFFTTGGMPLAWGLHFGWNAGLSILFDAPVSGYMFHVPLVEYTPGARAWIDGGAFGPEGGVVSTIALLAGTVWLLTRPNAFGSQSPVVSEEVAAA